MRIRLRKAEEEDIRKMSVLFQDTVRKINKADYTPEETEDWAACGRDVAHWKERMEQFHYIVAEGIEVKSNRIIPETRTGKEEMVGFAAVSDQGYLNAIFVHSGCQRCGVAETLLQEIEKYAAERGVKRIWAEVSITARPFFEWEGYKMVKEQKRQAMQLELKNFLMEKRLDTKE